MSRVARKKAEKQKNIRAIAVKAIIVCLIALALVSIYKIYKVHSDYKEGQETYQEVQEEVAPETEEKEFDGSTVDFKALKEKNPDTIGWIHYDDTPIDYPIVQGEDNWEYLYKAFDGTHQEVGTLFADGITKEPFRQFNTLVYGHNMKDGSMFASLEKLKEKSYAESHPKFVLVTEEGAYDLMVWAFLTPTSEHSVYSTNYTEEESKEKYIKAIEEEAKYTIGEVSADDKLVILSTCAYDFDGARYVVACKIGGKI